MFERTSPRQEQVNKFGELTLFTYDGVNDVTGAGSHPVDKAFGSGDQFLYALASGNTTINAFQIHTDGTLTPWPATVRQQRLPVWRPDIRLAVTFSRPS